MLHPKIVVGRRRSGALAAHGKTRTRCQPVGLRGLLALVLLVSAACGSTPGPASTIVPQPSSVQLASGRFSFTRNTRIIVRADDEAASKTAARLVDLLQPALGGPLKSVTGAPADSAPGSVYVGADAPDASLGSEGYDLDIGSDRVRLTARGAAGLFHGFQTMRQLLPASVEYRAALPRPVDLPAGRIVDRPRFAYRGAMLDIARHFFGLDDLKRYVDLIALYKINHLHLHLSDDQGWRLEIRSRPTLTANGGTTGVQNGPREFLMQPEYEDLVAYAAARFIVIVPEIEMPAHIGAALAAYPELNCRVKNPDAGSDDAMADSLCVDRETTYAFITDVVREIAALTPGPYFHIGGDEVSTLTPDQYRRFIERVQPIVVAAGKRPIGWDEIAQARRLPETIVQHWRPEFRHGREDMPLLLSPAQKVYLDMKYDATTALGLDWAALIEVRDAYEWDPVRVAGVAESSIVGIEAPLWSETLKTMPDVEFMAFPRLPAVAEVAWTPQAARRWDEFRVRLRGQWPRWTALGVNAYRSPQLE